MAGDAPPSRHPSPIPPNPLTGNSLLTDEPETTSRTPADIRSLTLAVLAGSDLILPSGPCGTFSALGPKCPEISN